MRYNQYDPINILLADDDLDDFTFFNNALSQISIRTNVMVVKDGEQLMHHLSDNSHKLPDVLFLDINMPRKNGFECLAEMKLNIELAKLPVIIMSTSVEPEVVSRLYNDGAKYFIRKPAEFSQFKEIIYQTLLLIRKGSVLQPNISGFVLTAPPTIVT